MKTYRKSFRSFDNKRIVYRSWLVEKPIANLVIVHGAGEHSGRYNHIVDHFVALDFNVFVWDARGHGDSEGQRGHIQSWRDFREDIHYYLKAVRRDFAGQPVFLLGHSLGGLKTLDYVLHYPHEDIRGYICSSPAIGEVGVSPLLLTAAKVMDKVVPNLSINTGLDLENISRDPDWLDQTREDQLYHSKGTPRLAIEVQRTAEWVHSHADELNYPILMLHGTADEICQADGSRRFYANTSQQDKTLIEYEGGYHELFNDTVKDKALGDVQHWIEAHL